MESQNMNVNSSTEYRHGTEKEWYENRKIKLQAYYQHDKLNDYYREWDENGNITVERFYKNNTIVSQYFIIIFSILFIEKHVKKMNVAHFV